MANGIRDRIVTEENLERLVSGIQAAEEAEEMIDLAKQAGLDVDALEQRNRDTKNQLLRIKQTFFPGR